MNICCILGASLSTGTPHVPHRVELRRGTTVECGVEDPGEHTAGVLLSGHGLSRGVLGRVECATWREHTRKTPIRGSQTRLSRTVEGLAFGPGVLDPKPPASKQASKQAR